MSARRRPAPPCWRGKDSPHPFVAGVPETLPRARSLPGLFRAMACCTRCELAIHRTQVVHGVGNAKARLVLIGEAPGAKEDRAGSPFVGAAGRLLDGVLERVRIDRDDVFITNIVACRPPKNRTPKASEIKAHAPWIEAQLALLDPVLIVTLGRVALSYFVPKAKVTELRGRRMAVSHGGRRLPILPTLHPAAALRDPERLPLIEKDFRKAAAILRRG